MGLIIFILFIIFLLILYINAINTEHKNKITKEEQERIKLEYKEKREKEIKEKKEEFDNNLNSIKELKVSLSENIKVKKKLISEIPEYTHSKIRKNTSLKNLSNFVVLDVETTGLNARTNELIEISMIKFENFEPIEYISTLVKPKKEITNEITNINNITNEMCSQAPTISEVIPAFSEFIKGYNLVGYNIDFDLKFLFVNGLSIFDEKRKYYDVLKIAKQVLDYDDVYDFKLINVCNYFNIYRHNEHRSLSDSYATALLYKKLINWIVD